jgi:hypothetical protein
MQIPRFEFFGEGLHSRDPIVTMSGEETRPAIFEARHNSIAVELDLVDPLASRRDIPCQRAELRR